MSNISISLADSSEQAKKAIDDYFKEIRQNLKKNNIENFLLDEIEAGLKELMVQLKTEVIQKVSYQYNQYNFIDPINDELNPVETAKDLYDTINIILDKTKTEKEKLIAFKDFSNRARDFNYPPLTRAIAFGAFAGIGAGAVSLSILLVFFAIGAVPGLIPGFAAVCIPLALGFAIGSAAEFVGIDHKLENRGKKISNGLRFFVNNQEKMENPAEENISTPVPVVAA